jgi:hypothetical protein
MAAIHGNVLTSYPAIMVSLLVFMLAHLCLVWPRRSAVR